MPAHEPLPLGLQYCVMKEFTLTSSDAGESTSNLKSLKPAMPTGIDHALRSLSFVVCSVTANALV